MKISEKKVLTIRAFFAIISLVHDEHAPIAQLDRAFDYESKGHRFESCWVHHEPLTSFAPLAVFLNISKAISTHILLVYMVFQVLLITCFLRLTLRRDFG